MPRIPNWLVSVASLSLCVGLLAGTELLHRRLYPGYLVELDPEEGVNVYSETYGWRLRPGFHSVGGEKVTINEDGYRGPIRTVEKPNARPRILMLGDSIGFGEGVDDDHTFSARLAQRRFDVVNLSVGGYGTDQELIKLENEGLRFKPDVVLLHFCLFADTIDNALATQLFDERQRKPYFTWDGSALVRHDAHLRLTPQRRVAQWISDYSHVYNWLRLHLALARPQRVPGVWMDRRSAIERHLGPVADLTFRLIARMNEVARGAGAQFIVVIHPDKFGYHHRSRMLRKFCETPLLEGIRVLELGDQYRARGLDWDDFSMDVPGHLTDAGHAAAADALEVVLRGTAPPDWDYRTTCATRASPQS